MIESDTTAAERGREAAKMFNSEHGEMPEFLEGFWDELSTENEDALYEYIADQY